MAKDPDENSFTDAEDALDEFIKKCAEPQKNPSPEDKKNWEGDVDRTLDTLDDEWRRTEFPFNHELERSSWKRGKGGDLPKGNAPKFSHGCG